MINKLVQKIKDFSNDERFKDILQGSVYSFLAKILTKILGLISSVIIARYYGAEVIGYISIILSILGITGLLSNFGMSTSILRLIPEYIGKYSKEAGFAIYNRMLILTIIFSFAMSLCLYSLSEFIANDIFHNYELKYFFILSSIILIFSSINILNIATIRAIKKIKQLAYFELLPSVLTLILLLLFTYSFYNKYNPIYILFYSILIISILTTIYVNKVKKSEVNENKTTSPLSYKYIVILSFPMFLTAGLQLITGHTDIIMLGIFMGEDQVGIYSIVLSLSLLTSFLLNSINTIAAPKFSELYHENKMNDFKHVAQKSTRMIFWSTLPIILVLMLFGQLILEIYGTDFTVGYTALLLLTFGQFINSISGSVGYLLNMTGHHKIFQNIILLSAIINILLNYLLIPKYGINGAAFASMISIISWNIIATIYIKKIFGFYIVYFPNLLKIFC